MLKSIDGRRSLLIGLLFVATMFADGMTFGQSHAAGANGPTRADFLRAVRKWPAGPDKRIALWLARNTSRLTRVNEAGEYAPQWRDGREMSAMGICAHYDRKTGKWFLESQYSKAERKRRGLSPAKYIRFDGRGPWRGRTHKKGMGLDYHYNWKPIHTHDREARELARRIDRKLRR